MRTLYLLRHGQTAANEARLYCGSTDIPLSDRGRDTAWILKAQRPLPECGFYASSGMKRAEETLELLTGHRSDRVIHQLREMDFGRFEMCGYDSLKADPDYLRWIGDDTGSVCCPGGECATDFGRRVLWGADILLALSWSSALTVCHGGPIVRLMEAWFPEEGRNFYEWQPGSCRGWRILFDDAIPIDYSAI